MQYIPRNTLDKQDVKAQEAVEHEQKQLSWTAFTFSKATLVVVKRSTADAAAMYF